jgi:hypothetical protein
MQLKTDILNDTTYCVSVATSPDESINLEESYDPPLPNVPLPTGTTNMLDILLNSIGGNLSTVNNATPDDQNDTATAKMLCKNELHQLLLGNDFKMKMQNTETKAFNCPLSWWKSSAHRFKNSERLAVKYLAIPATSAPSERISSQAARVLTVRQYWMPEEVTSAIMYCKENTELLHKYYMEIAKERMHPDDHHLIEKHKALLPTFEHGKDGDLKIDVGVDVDEEWCRTE